MFNDNTFRYSEERRKELEQDAHRIRQARYLKERKRECQKSMKIRQGDLTDYIKTGLAAIFHR
jgi:hypothetical protein